MRGETCDLGGRGGGGLSLGLGGKGGSPPKPSSLLLTLRADFVDAPECSMILAAGLGLDGDATMGVGLYNFGFVCLKGLEGESRPPTRGDDSMVEAAMFSEVDRECVASLKGLDGPGDLVLVCLGLSGITGGGTLVRDEDGISGCCSGVSGEDARREAAGCGFAIAEAVGGGGGTLLLGGGG